MAISDRRGNRTAGATLAVTLWLAGCAGDAPALVSRSFTPLAGPPVTYLLVQDDTVTIKGPPGYCIDATATRDRADGVFVMLGDCARLFSAGTTSPEMSAVLTALVSGPSDQAQQPSPAQLERFFRSEAGRAALSLDGDAATVTIDQTRVAGDTLLFLMHDASSARPEGLSDRSWRAVLTLRDRLVSLAVTAHREEPLKDRDARDLLETFIAAMRVENENGATPAE
ncbi:MAG: hypothetical protein NXH97_15395 [Rhodobacteraceae bacterium]|nr:hypothetical protein [Paracoccaceae bacterium]